MDIREKHGEWSVRDSNGLHKFKSEEEALAFLNGNVSEPEVVISQQDAEEDFNEDGGS
jgi:hypothetical protein